MEYISEIIDALELYAKSNSDYEYDEVYHLELLKDLHDGLESKEDKRNIQNEIDYICKEFSRCPVCFNRLYPTKIDENSVDIYINPYEEETVGYICEWCNKIYDSTYIKNS